MEQQISGIQGHAERLKRERPWLTIHPEVFKDESVSAFNYEFNQRPNGKRLLDMLQPGDQLIVYRLDRAWRLPHDAAKMAKDLAARNIGIHIVDAGIDTQSEFGEMWVTLLSVFAYLESKIKSTRNTEVAAMCRANGRPYSPIPRQFKVVKHKQTKRLVYDFEKIKRMAVCYICRKVLGHTEIDTCEIVHAIDCSLTGRDPVWRGCRKKMWGERNHTQKSILRFNELLVTMAPADAIRSIDDAVTLIEAPIEPRYLAHCKVGLPLACVRQYVEAHFASLQLLPNCR